ncbi:MAG TPA: hypothetical protein VGW75_14770 [Solirubrobacteraceae bacterium]|jgi:hypothetical protein|nr:hypothetical protein [Solirubrobacteraceae bacterium]
MRRLPLLALAAAGALMLLPAAAPAAAQCDPLDPAVCLQPFPNDFFTEADPTTATGRRIALRDELMPKNRLGKPISAADFNHSDGFSPGQAIFTRVPGLDTLAAFRNSNLPPIDDPARSLDSDSPVVVIDARTLRRHLVWAEIDSNPADPADRNLFIRPAVNFEEGARYIVALRNLRDANGAKIPAGDAFARYRDGRATDPRAAHMESLFAALKKAGVNRRQLFLAWDFTVASAQSTTNRMLSIRDRAFAQLGDTNLADQAVQGSSPTWAVNPDLPDDAPTSEAPDEAAIDGVRDFPTGPLARQVRGKITVPCFLDTPGCAPGGQFRYLPGSDGLVPLQLPGNTAVIDFTCNIPRHTGTLRPALYGHGLLGSQSEINQGQLKDLGAEHGFLFCATDWNGMAFKDIPTVLQILQDLSRFPALTDHVQQGFLGFLFLGRAMLHDDGILTDPAFAGVSVDRSALFYDGNSQGGIYGGALTAISPDVRRSVLGVPGMNYSTLLRRSVDFDTYAHGDFEGSETELGLYDSYPNELERPLILALMQMLWDRSDPNGYAHHMTSDPLPNTPAHEVLLHVGFGDHQVADVTTEVEARTIGARVHMPLLEPGRERFRDRPYPDRPLGPLFYGVEPLGPLGYSATGSGVVFWDDGPLRPRGTGTAGTPPPPAANLPPREGHDPHEHPRRSPLARRQKSEFLRVDGRIVDVCGGPCFADGYTGGGA